MSIRDFQERLKQIGDHSFQRVDRWSGGILGIFQVTIRKFSAAHGAEAAASMAYYAIFSLFPMLLSIIAIGSLFINESQELKLEVFRIVRLVIPVSFELITQNIDEILEKRGAIGALGAIGLLWSASGAFSTLFHNINRAWTKAAPLSILRSRLLAVGLILLAVIVMVAALFSNAILDLLPAIVLPFGPEGAVFLTPVWEIVSNLIPLATMLLIFTGLYKWIPNTRVQWAEAVWAASFAAIFWEVTTRIFTWYLSSGLAMYEIVYGALGAMIALLFWIYLNSFIIIFCAHLSAAIAHHRSR